MNFHRFLKFSLPFASLCLVSSGLAQSDPAVTGILQSSAVTVTLGYGYVESFAPLPPDPPINVNPGAKLTLFTGAEDRPISSVVWFKDDTRLASEGSPLVIDGVAADDSGSYHAEFQLEGKPESSHAGPIRVVDPVRQPLLNFSSRATISPANPALIGGFVVAPSPGRLRELKTLLIRAVGPALRDLGVANPLAAPQLRVFRRDGSEVELDVVRIPEFPSPALVASCVGAFPLPAKSNDLAYLVSLPGGIYTAHVTAADGGSGDALLEIYEVPDRALWWF